MPDLLTFPCQNCGAGLQVPIRLLPAEGPCPFCGSSNRAEAPAAAHIMAPERESSAPQRRTGAGVWAWRIAHTAVGIGVAAALGGGAFVYVHRKLAGAPETGRTEIQAESVSETLPTRREDGVVMLQMTESTPEK